MSNQRIRSLPPGSPIRLENRTCVYCSTDLTIENDTIEHVVGRRFVPRGKLDGQWNLIVHACRNCNENKARLEDDISAITMQPTVTGRHAVDDEVLAREAERKGAGSRSRLTGRAVRDSYEETKIEVPFAPGGKFTFQMTGLPAVEPERMFELAGLQVRAFFYWITYNETARLGYFWPGAFYTVISSARSDWGNAAQRAFMKAVQDWERRVHGIGAGEYFKISIRRHPTAACWSWAVEWNQNYRLIVFFGDQGAAERAVAGFPTLDWAPMPPGSSGTFRKEHPLSPGDDVMFVSGLIEPLEPEAEEESRQGIPDGSDNE